MIGYSPGDADRGSCRYCGAHVSERFRRGFGDNDGVPHRCPECDSWVRICEGSAAGLDVQTPDPQEHPERAPVGWSA